MNVRAQMIAENRIPYGWVSRPAAVVEPPSDKSCMHPPKKARRSTRCSLSTETQPAEDRLPAARAPDEDPLAAARAPAKDSLPAARAPAKDSVSAARAPSKSLLNLAPSAAEFNPFGIDGVHYGLPDDHSDDHADNHSDDHADNHADNLPDNLADNLPDGLPERSSPSASEERPCPHAPSEQAPSAPSTSAPDMGNKKKFSLLHQATDEDDPWKLASPDQVYAAAKFNGAYEWFIGVVIAERTETSTKPGTKVRFLRNRQNSRDRSSLPMTDWVWSAHVTTEKRHTEQKPVDPSHRDEHESPSDSGDDAPPSDDPVPVHTTRVSTRDVPDKHARETYVRWTEDEDRHMRKVVDACDGRNRWAEAASKIPNRTADQIRHRYKNVMIKSKPKRGRE